MLRKKNKNGGKANEKLIREKKAVNEQINDKNLLTLSVIL